jgi:hypothetical protein
MSVFALVTVAGGLGNPALAWDHTFRVWDTDNFPVEWWFADNVDDNISLEEGETAITTAIDNWVEGAPCATLSQEFQGVREGHNGGFIADSTHTYSFEDALDDLDGGTLAANVCFEAGEFAFSLDGENYYYSYDCDVVYNDTTPWMLAEDIDAGLCTNEYSLESVTTHETGHLFGMGHSCEEEDACDDPDLRYATMYWSTGPCDNYQNEVKDDDIEGIYALYGPYCSFEANENSERYGGVPHEVCFDVECNEPPENVVWNFGDGNTSEELEPCHTYTDKGQFPVSLTTSGSGEVCGEWENTRRERAYVLVCGEPAPADGFEGLFTYSHYDGTIYQMVNQTDTTVYGCIDQIQWDVFKNDELVQSVSAWSPKIDFAEEGTYRIVLNVGGPGGFQAGELTIDVEDKPGEVSSGWGCAIGSASASMIGLMVGLGAAVRRRREDH